MIICGVYGYTDAGKTTLIESLLGREISKYKQEKKRGITLKVGYAEVPLNKGLYFLDHPGHYALSIEALRNIDVIDFGIYMVDSTCINNPEVLELVHHNYQTYRAVFKALKIPYCLMLNKADAVDNENMLKLYELFKGDLADYVIPTCLINNETINDLRTTIDNLDLKPKTHHSDAVGRVLKSFDVNPEGVNLTHLKGGVLGLYLYNDIKIGDELMINDRFSKGWEPIVINSLKMSCQDRICTAETMSQPSYYKNDRKKCTYVTKDPSKNTYLDHIEVKFKVKSILPVKAQELLIVYGGQVFNVLVKKVSKSQVTLKVKTNMVSPVRVSNGPILAFSKNVKDQKKGLTFYFEGQIDREE